MFIRNINRSSREDVKGKGLKIICKICKHSSRIVGRRNSKWMGFIFLEIIRIKKYETYAACSHCLNPLPVEFRICEVCEGVVEKGEIECSNCN